MSTPSWREQLVATGWDQGSLFPADFHPPIAGIAHRQTQGLRQARNTAGRLEREDGETPETFPFVREPRDGDRLALLTQRCDVVKDPGEFPLVEAALAVTPENAHVIAEASNLGSARYFRLSPRNEDGPVTVLDFRWRMQLDKGVLLEIAPDNSLLGDSDQRFSLARWLGRRYQRPVLSDHDTKTISQPIREAWTSLLETAPFQARAFTEAFPEVRFRKEGGTLTVLVVSLDREIDQRLGLEFGNFLASALEDFHAEVKVSLVSYDSFSMSEYVRSEQLDMEWASYDEGETVGVTSAA